MTGQTGTQASQDDDYEFPGLPASPALDAHYEASQLIVNDARRQGTPTRTRKIFPGAFSDITYAEPLAGIKLAQARRSAADRVVSDYIKYARQDGAGWREIGKATGLERAAEETGHDLAELAFQQATGQPLGSGRDDYAYRDPSFGWTCRNCGEVITDRGPYSGPVDDERGHKLGRRVRVLRGDTMTEASQAPRVRSRRAPDQGRVGSVPISRSGRTRRLPPSRAPRRPRTGPGTRDSRPHGPPRTCKTRRLAC